MAPTLRSFHLQKGSQMNWASFYRPARAPRGRWRNVFKLSLRDTHGPGPLPQEHQLAQTEFVTDGSKPSEQAYFHHQRKQADAPDSALQKAWFNSMKNILEEIDQVLRCIPDRMPFRFLDLGYIYHNLCEFQLRLRSIPLGSCCPGGFSSYILEKNSRASGVGISLPIESGGHACLLEEDHLLRFELHWADLTQYQLGPTFIDGAQLQNFPVSPGFDLVLIDGHPLRSASSDIHLDGDRLLISQVIAGFVSVAFGGTIIFKQSKPERLVTSQLIFLFDGLCAEVRTWKPVCMHGTRSTFYIVAKGFGLGSRALLRQQMVGGLMSLWVELSFAQGSRGRTGRKLRATDLNFIVDSKTLKTDYAPRLRELSEHIWTTQSKCLQGWRNAQADGF
ncbi:hypothetical protein B0H17DRAFT_1131144 [Mycena rosella]|uniref:Ribosomal RNA methyltransferase FtsJ domain-containing protein n=1 Tax=Mycena rosella TaxID=1033263 RepID=A0AAD7GND4_MYCRO|nr:hypothetical protein B0H17DRAFT_1131144 [Mycena rosella]